MKVRVILTILLFGLGSNIFAYPITPEPLRKLVEGAELIVFADVIKIEDRSKATLVVKEKLQGDLISDTISVYFYPQVVCPTPANYVEGTSVLAFLDKQDSIYTTHALSYGSKTMKEEHYQIYRSRIVEIQTILQIDNENERTQETIEWLVNCAIDSVTRWEGVCELYPYRNFFIKYTPELDLESQQLKLNEEQKGRLRKVVFDIEILTDIDLPLVDLVVGESDQELIDLLIKHLNKLDAAQSWIIGDLMYRIAALSNRKDLMKIADETVEIDYFDEDRIKKLKQFQSKFLEQF